MNAAHDNQALASDGSHCHDGHCHDDDGPHSSLSGYIIGFVLSVILTAIPFAVVMCDVFDSRNTTILVVSFFAVVQIIVHMVYFLHMDGKTQGGWTLLSTIFTVIIVAIALAGTLWVMFHMNKNMMPSHVDMSPAAMQMQDGGHEHAGSN